MMTKKVLGYVLCRIGNILLVDTKETISRDTLQTMASSNMNDLNESVFLRVEGGDGTHMRKNVSVVDSNASLDFRDNAINGYGTLSRFRSSHWRCYI